EKLRKELKKLNSRIKVIKNSLFEKAVNRLSNTNPFFRAFRKKILPLKYNTALATFEKEPYEGLKIIFKFLKEKDLYLKGGVIDSEIYSKDEIERLAQLPGKTELIAKIYTAINAPVYRTVYALKFNLLKLAFVLKQVAEKKKGGENNG
ncbi:MAG TPA: 50S ribosomal protein L10, partial [Armatimonadetes bacterium]|nr:50S ribosomal protein L10 [Armatimonadota bacterium]